MAKRSHGEGTVRKRTLKRDDGTSYVRYFAVITNGNQTDGSQKRLEGPWRKTRPEANRDRIELLKQLEQGVLNRAGDSCLSDYLDYWLEQRQHDLRPRSMQAYRGDSKNHVKPYLGNIKLNKLTPLHVQSWQTELLKNNSAYVTRKARACLSAALTQAVQWQVIPVNPVDAVAAVRMPDNDIQVWEPCEVRTFLNATQGHRFYAAYFLTLSLGLRLGEVRGLKWSDIIGNTLHVQRTLSGDKATPKFGPPKTKKGDRLLPIPLDVLSILNRSPPNSREGSSRSQERLARLRPRLHHGSGHASFESSARRVVQKALAQSGRFRNPLSRPAPHRRLAVDSKRYGRRHRLGSSRTL